LGKDFRRGDRYPGYPVAADFEGGGRIGIAVAAEVAVSVFFNRTAPPASRDLNHNAIPDECEPRTPFHRGDPNSSGMTDISDALTIFGYLFLGSDYPTRLESADVNNSGEIDISDGIVAPRIFRTLVRAVNESRQCTFKIGVGLVCDGTRLMPRHWVLAQTWRMACTNIILRLLVIPACLIGPLMATITGTAADDSVAATARAAPLVISGVNIFDPVAGAMLPERTVVIKDGRIQSIGTRDRPAATPPGARTIDAKGKFLLPGLIDAHVHVVHVLDYAHVTGDEILPLFLAAGVTSVRSTGDEIVAATLVARIAREHPERAPRVFTCSPLLDGDPPIHADVGRAVVDPAKVPALVEEMALWGVTRLKIYAGCGRAAGRAIIEAGHRHGLLVTAHLGAYSAGDAVADGIDCLEHITSVAFFLRPEDLAIRSGAELFQQLSGRKVMVDPTLVVFRNMILLPDDPTISGHADNACVPRRLREFWPTYLRSSNLPAGSQRTRREQLASYQEVTRRLKESGVALLVGTDAPEPYVPPGFAIHQELQLLVESGLSPAAALSAATLGNARAVRQSEHLGTIAEGKLADLVLLKANPLEAIGNSRSIELVIHAGIVCQPDELLRLVPVQ